MGTRHCIDCGTAFKGFGSRCPVCWDAAWGDYVASRQQFPVQIITLPNPSEEDTTEVAPVDTANLEAMRRLDRTNDNGRS